MACGPLATYWVTTAISIRSFAAIDDSRYAKDHYVMHADQVSAV